MNPTFPDDFIWGVATAAYQIEGAVREDGRGLSIWDTYSHTAGNTLNGDTGDIACDHYHRMPQDVALMRELGVQAYRFSTAWPRIIPAGKGQVNSAGLAFYDRLVDTLLENNIEPYLTLYHWDLPQALQDQGGWASRDIAGHFATYADVVSRHLGDRVKKWMTLNEPFVFTFIAHFVGRHAPGLRHFPTAIRTAHHALLAHGKALEVLRANCPDAEIGLAVNLSRSIPATDREDDLQAAELMNAYHNLWFLDPIYKGAYPQNFLDTLDESIHPALEPDDMQLISQPIDFLGINYYFPHFVRAKTRDENGFTFREETLEELQKRPYEITEMKWPIVPDSFYQTLCDINERYHPQAIYITENGGAFPDQLIADKVDDPRRIAYLNDHIGAMQDALNAGVPLKAYFHWSFLDNFEWAYGYERRFGLVYTDYASQQRIPKSSFYWYQQLIDANRIPEKGH